MAPGDYHETNDLSHPPLADDHGRFAGVLVTTPNLHIRGMDRSSVIIDGTNQHASGACSSNPPDQNFGTTNSSGQPIGRNGIVVWKANNVSIENLTACNFLGGSGDAGNEIWWNGGADSAKIGLSGYTGRYLTATSTFFATESNAAKYGIFSSDARGVGLWDQVYASNMNDSGLYVGACIQECGMTIQHAWMQYSALGYSGTNSGGAIVIRNSEFDHNQDGFDTNTQIAGDPPAPQDGRCPNGGTSPITHTHSCWVFMNNYVHDNNNPNVPASGNASLGPVGTGMTIAGGRFDTIMNNVFENNGAWGMLMLPFPDSGTPEPGTTCEGEGGVQVPGFGCVLDARGNALIHNTFRHNGSFGNPSNGDFGELVIAPGLEQNCFRENVSPDGSTPSDLQISHRLCGPNSVAPDLDPNLFSEVLCNTGFGSCNPGSVYPRQTQVVMHPLPKLPTMPNPCADVPNNTWCHNGQVA